MADEDTTADQGDTGADVEVPDSTVSDDNSTEQDNSTEPSKAPWADYLQKFPTSLHGTAEEVFKEWDGNVTKRFQDLHSQYKPYEDLVNNWEPDALAEAVQLAQALERDPRAFVEALTATFGLDEGEQGDEDQEELVDDEPEFDLDDPLQVRLAQQEELLRTLAEKIIGDEQAKISAQEEAEQEQWLEQTLDSLKKERGEFDENFVLQQIAAGVDPEEAVDNFFGLVSEWAKKQNSPAQNAPRVMRSSGGVPSNQVNPAELSSKDTKALVANLLREAAGG